MPRPLQNRASSSRHSHLFYNPDETNYFFIALRRVSRLNPALNLPALMATKLSGRLV
jgi:hypothetical protein